MPVDARPGNGRPSLEELLPLIATSPETPGRLGQDAMDALARMLGSPAVLVYMLGPPRAFRLAGATGLSASALEALATLEAGGVEAVALCEEMRGATRFDRASATAEPCRTILRETGAAHVVAAPLRACGRLCGALAFAEGAGVAQSTSRVEAIASAIGLALSAAHCAEVTSQYEDLLLALDRERANLRNILDAAPDGILFLDAKTRRVVGNEAFEQLLGRPIDPEEGSAQEVGIIQWPDGKTVPLEELPSRRALRTGERVRQELLFVQAPGRRVPVEEHAAPITGPDGSCVGVVVTCRDLTAHKELERLREEFAAMVAHDLRNPIQSMLMQLRMLRADAEQGRPVAQAPLDRLTRLAHRMGRLTGDLLDSVRIDLARVALDRSPRDTLQAVRDVVDHMQPAVSDHPIRVEAPAPVPAVSIDACRFEQILTNLVENAAKYSPTGAPIEISVTTADHEVDIAVHDHGAGIAPEELPLLFDRFYQTERARRSHSGGLGLGLYIAKGFVQAHGGKLSVESAVDQGSTFHVVLPPA